MHRAGYIHRDICPRNFVVDKNCESLKLIDFGLTVPATPPFMQPGNRTGTANYMAPEVVRRRPTSQKLDIFSFGVTAYELCAFELPWPRGAGTGRHGPRLARADRHSQVLPEDRPAAAKKPSMPVWSRRPKNGRPRWTSF